MYRLMKGQEATLQKGSENRDLSRATTVASYPKAAARMMSNSSAIIGPIPKIWPL